METTNTFAQPMPAPALAAKPRIAPAVAPAIGADLPPWLDEDAAPMTVAARRQPRRAMPVSRPEFETVHWSVVALTLFTAVSVLLGAFGGEPRPKELLPIVITVAS